MGITRIRALHGLGLEERKEEKDDVLELQIEMRRG
jgi:hypothetical protein